MGILVGEKFSLAEREVFIIGGAVALLTALAIIFHKEPMVAIFSLVLASFIAGGSFLNFYLSRLELPSGIGQEREITGIVKAGAQKEKSSQYVVSPPNYPNILLVAPLDVNLDYGDKIKFKGKLELPQKIEDFDYPSYLKAKYQVTATVKAKEVEGIEKNQGNPLVAILVEIKQKYLNILQKSLPGRESALLAGLILGEEGRFSKEFKEAMSKTGTSHIVAVSGYNITIVLFLFFAAVRRVSYRLAIVTGFLAILAFIILTGAQASVVRAGIMGGLFLLAKAVGRMSNITLSLFWAGFFMLLFNPLILRYDIGFQLSFLAVLGLVYFSPIFEGWLLRIGGYQKLHSFIREALTATLGAQLMTLPVLLANFGRLSLVAPLTNVLILPLIPLTMGFGAVVTLPGFISLLIAKITSLLAWPLLYYITGIVEAFSRLPFAAVGLKTFPLWASILYFVGLIYVYKLFGTLKK